MICARVCFVAGAAAVGVRPHVIVLLADDLGFGDVGFHPPVRELDESERPSTPHIDAMARSPDTVVLERNYAASPMCTPSRAALHRAVAQAV